MYNWSIELEEENKEHVTGSGAYIVHHDQNVV